MPTAATTPLQESNSSSVWLSANEIGKKIAAGELSSQQVVEDHISRIEEANVRINAVVENRFEQARAEAIAADRQQAQGDQLGPLHGVPMTVKESFHVKGLSATLGLSKRASDKQDEDGILVQRLKSAGAIILGTTNVPQLMILHESVNPVYGETRNPWNLERVAGGSSGGEAAIIAAGGSPCGLASDIGGSIRIPGHFCGIHGLKPTSRRLPRTGCAANLRGMDAIVFQPGPMARSVDDLSLLMRVLISSDPQVADFDVPPVEFRDPSQVDISKLRIARWEDDGFFTPSPAIRRAIREAAEALLNMGAEIVEFKPPDVDEGLRLYFSVISADGGTDLKRLAKGSKIDKKIKQLLRLGGVPPFYRSPISLVMKAFGQDHMASLMEASGPRSADDYWQLTQRTYDYTRRFLQAFTDQKIDAFLSPSHAVPAFLHGQGVDLMPAACYSFLPNLLGVPVGNVAATTIGSSEQSDREGDKHSLAKAAVKAEEQSVGLPVGVQVGASHWRDDIVLAVMAALEKHFQSQASYPKFNAW